MARSGVFAWCVRAVIVLFATYVVAAAVFFVIRVAPSFMQESKNWVYRPSGKVLEFATWKELDDPGFGNMMVPKEATCIKRYYDCGFGYQSCNISCIVGIGDLLRFAESKGYCFERRDRIPFLGDEPVLDELDVCQRKASELLYCRARDSEHRVEIPGWGNFGTLTFIYDIPSKRLYGSYFD